MSESLDFDVLRRMMVDAIVVHARMAGPDTGRPELSGAVLDVMADVPRHEFVPFELRAYAYFDTPLPIGFGKTISQPYIVALMTDLLEIRPQDRVLDVGTGLGYQTAVLARLGSRIYSVEIIEELAKSAMRRLAEQGCSNVEVTMGDGSAGWAEHAPFDRILVGRGARPHSHRPARPARAGRTHGDPGRTRRRPEPDAGHQRRGRRARHQGRPRGAVLGTGGVRRRLSRVHGRNLHAPSARAPRSRPEILRTTARKSIDAPAPKADHAHATVGQGCVEMRERITDAGFGSTADGGRRLPSRTKNRVNSSDASADSQRAISTREHSEVVCQNRRSRLGPGHARRAIKRTLVRRGGGRRPDSAGLSVRLLESERDIDEMLPLALAVHEESRHRSFSLDPERCRRFFADRFLADSVRYGLLIARHEEPSGGDARVPCAEAASQRRDGGVVSGVLRAGVVSAHATGWPGCAEVA